MLQANAIAFKEWAVVCAALGSGQQSLILRKGGIHEGRGGFRVAHSEFWLFPTAFHQAPEVLAPAAAPLLHKVMQQQPPDGAIHLHDYVLVEKVFEIHEESRLAALSPWHIWSMQTVMQRFQYKSPGLFALLVRVFRLPQPISIADEPAFAGCRSWVELTNPVETASITPVLTDDAHEERMQQLEQCFSP